MTGLAVMVVFSAAIAVVGRRSETVGGLLDHRDERISGIDLRATAFTAIAMILAVLVGFLIEVSLQGIAGLAGRSRSGVSQEPRRIPPPSR
ncbi:MAG TPA: hypothetical protein VMV92_36025 [Streptosporangiaceae bacterium]|nr:hypothetical protein [Streptosporangiaceae bacterium]